MIKNSKYTLTYDLRILYCPNLSLREHCKILNFDTLEFEPFDGNIEELDNGYELPAESLKNVSDRILLGQIGYELPEKEMKWIQDFESLLKNDISLITNRELAFNYFILKLSLLGFSSEMAKNIVIHYYSNIINNIKVAHPQSFLKEINRVLANKNFWVKYDLQNPELMEYKYIKDFLKARYTIGYTFTFDIRLRQEYLDICKNGVAVALINYNKTPSYLVQRTANPTELMRLLEGIYKKIIWGLIVKAYADLNRPIDEVIAKNLVKDLTSTMKEFLSKYKN